MQLITHGGAMRQYGNFQPTLFALGSLMLAACGGSQSVVPAQQPKAAGGIELPPIGPPPTESGSSSETLGFSTAPDGPAPAERFDLKAWKLTLPDVGKGPGRAREVKERALAGLKPGSKPFVSPLWFYVDAATGAMVFKTPNHLASTKNSKNTRSELREMIRAGQKGIGTKDMKNNWALASHPRAAEFAAIGGVMSAKLAVDWVSTSGDDAKFSAYSVVVGQIHGSGKMEPLKIFFRKLPGHQKGSLFWNYETRPADDNDRQDVSTDIWGSHELTHADPTPSDGIALGEAFSYVVEVIGSEMRLTFTRADGTESKFTHDLSVGHPDVPGDRGFSDDWMYFKAGAYNQCNIGVGDSPWASGCQNRGQEAGDYTQVSFFELKVEHPS